MGEGITRENEDAIADTATLPRLFWLTFSHSMGNLLFYLNVPAI
jgi:hypothetical protein